MAQLLDALHYAHEQGVWHRDIKPANIIVMNNGKLKIADFGIARIDSSNLTQTGSIMGTPGYMAPEQYSGPAVDWRADIFSAGVVMYQLLAGVPPLHRQPRVDRLQDLSRAAGPALRGRPRALHYAVRRGGDEGARQEPRGSLPERGRRSATRCSRPTRRRSAPPCPKKRSSTRSSGSAGSRSRRSRPMHRARRRGHIPRLRLRSPAASLIHRSPSRGRSRLPDGTQRS